ncbi:MAG: LptF/LptG family permease, partial [Spirochaetota bacterium]|nr:LptF/LptG family permease [Spirochaetota bacterium]
HVIKDAIDPPDHFLIQKKPMDRLTFSEGMRLVDSLKQARKKWREDQIDLYANKLAFQLSTFLIVFVGSSLGQFHSRKLIFVNSLFHAILIFLLYFILFQLGVSFAKITDIMPIYFAPWLGNIVFFVFGVYMLRKAKT